jgi:hypothetical protein
MDKFLQPLFLNLSNENKHRTFQQDDVTAQTANNSMAASHNNFGDQMMNQSPFMAYYYLWVCFLRTWWPNIISDKGLWKATGQGDTNLEIRKIKFGWIGHTLRKEEGEIPKAALLWNPQGSR